MVPKKQFIQGGIKRVLIVDNNNEMLESLKVGLEKYNQQFETLLANDGEQALDILKEKPISIVVSDVKMPKMNGLALLASMTTQFPDIPVIIISAYGQDELEWLARKSGAVAFISKPFSVDEIGEKILSFLQKESDGGVIKGISVGVFMQLAEMEEMTCTIRVFSEEIHTQGVVFFKQGRPMDARFGNVSGEKAIIGILSLEHAHLRIQNSCPDLIESKIDSGLQALLLEAMRQKDEGGTQENELSIDPRVDSLHEKASTPSEPSAIDQDESPKMGNPNTAKVVKTIQNEIGNRFGWHQIDSGSVWEHTVTLSLKIGDLFSAGRFKCGYIRKMDNQNNLFIPGSPSAILKVDQNCPRDRIFRIVNRTS